MAQTTHNNAPALGYAGLVADAAYADIRTYRAAVDIPFGRVVEINSSGEVALPLSTSLGNVVGVATYNPSKEPYGAGVDVANSNEHGYKAGEIVPVLRKGQVWAEFDGTAASVVRFGACNVRHPSGSVATSVLPLRGKVTQAATSTTAGAEVSAQAGIRFVDVPTANVGLALIEVNLPQ